jgi:trehalose 6-phosphate synthase
MPIHFMHKSVNFEELLALYAVSDACIVSSTRDGMNLVSFEYIASQQKRQGVLILSEFAGAAQSLNGSLVVNPWNTEDLAKAYHQAMSMPSDQRAARYQKLWKYISKYTRSVCPFSIDIHFLLTVRSKFWGTSFVAELSKKGAHIHKEI